MAKRVIFITGASSGIGYASALKFMAAGDSVVGTARRADRLEQLAQAAVPLPGDFLPVVADVCSAATMATAMQTAVDHFGRIDVLIANAGVGHRGGLIESEWDGIEQMLRTNIDGVLHSIRAAVPVMRQSGGGHIIIVSSVTYNLVAPYAAVYAASKAFVSSLSRSLRLELQADNIAVTDMLVGRVETEFNEKRLGQSGRGGKFPPTMPVDRVAEAIYTAAGSRRKSVAIRWVDRLVLMGNLLIPDFIGKKALKQYR